MIILGVLELRQSFAHEMNTDCMIFPIKKKQRENFRVVRDVMTNTNKVYAREYIKIGFGNSDICVFEVSSVLISAK